MRRQVKRGETLPPTEGSLLLRRRFVELGGAGMAALGLGSAPVAWGSRPERGTKEAAPKACILVFYYGGPSHLDTWDMKPDAPAEVRGEFASIATNVPGIRVCEHLPRCARVMDKLALVRGFYHKMRNHNAAAVEALCGRTPLRGDLELLADDELSFPCYGAALGYAWKSKGLTAPVPPVTAVALPHVMYNVVRLPGQGAGLLGAPFQPLQIEADPGAPNFKVDSLEYRDGMSPDRLAQREALWNKVDLAGADLSAKRGKPMDAFYRRTFSLLRSEPMRRALDLGHEPAGVRDRYGRNTHGQSLLLARRLVEAGVPFLTVFDKTHNGQDVNWDSHQKVFTRHRDHLLPPADQGLSALIEDLDTRGLLETTMVIALGEFGRTPKINRDAGRDHWPDCFTIVMAGGGIRGGQVRGSSDRIGAYPDTVPTTPGDLAATLFDYFGLDPAMEMHDATGRPFRLAEGEPMRDLFHGSPSARIS